MSYGAAEDSESHKVDLFEHSNGLTSAEADALLKIHGPNALPEKSVPKWYVFLSLLWQPMPIMIWIAIIIEAAIYNWVDMAILLFIQYANAGIAFYETTKAEDAVAELKRSLQPKAEAKRDGKWITMDATELVPSDLVKLHSGANIPADCRLKEGTIDVDESQLNGESLPRTVSPYSPGQKDGDDAVMMGSTVARGEGEATVEFTGANTFFGRTASLLGGDGEFSNLQNVLIDIMIVLVLLSLTLCSIVFVYLVRTTSVDEALSFVVVLLIASIPLAIEIVTTTTLALGSHELSEEGAIVKRLACIEDMAGMAILCSDKTGTLTMNKMVIQDYTPVYQPGETQYSLLRYAAMAARWHETPKDALDRLVLGSVDMPSLDAVEQLEYVPFDPVTKYTKGTVRDSATGKQFSTAKGAPNIILKLCDGHEDPELSARVMTDVDKLAESGIRSLAVAKTDDEGNMRFLGLLTFLDPPRFDTKDTIAKARSFGVAVKMITGDHLNIAKETARLLDMGTNIFAADGLPVLDEKTKEKPKNLAEDYGELCMYADGFAQVFPEHKYLIVECLRELGYKVGMTGDGVNDAPALKRADVGVAVEGSTDAAKAAADIVLTEPGLSAIITGIVIARKIFCRIRSFFTYRISATLQLLVFFFIAVFAFKPSDYQPNPNPDGTTWPAFFSMPVLMLMLITLLNDGSLISIGYDNVRPSPTLEKWNLRVLFTIGTVLGGIACISSLLLLYLLLDSWNPNGVFQTLGIGGLSYGQIITSIYLEVSLIDFLTLFSARAADDFFWTSVPAPILFAAAATAMTMSTLLACVWPPSYPDGIYTLGLARESPYLMPVYIWAYSILFFLIEDVCKVGAYKVMRMYNIFGINDSDLLVLPPVMPESVKEYARKCSQSKKTH